MRNNRTYLLYNKRKSLTSLPTNASKGSRSRIKEKVLLGSTGILCNHVKGQSGHPNLLVVFQD